MGCNIAYWKDSVGAHSREFDSPALLWWNPAAACSTVNTAEWCKISTCQCPTPHCKNYNRITHEFYRCDASLAVQISRSEANWASLGRLRQTRSPKKTTAWIFTTTDECVTRWVEQHPATSDSNSDYANGPRCQAVIDSCGGHTRYWTVVTLNFKCAMNLTRKWTF